MLNIFCKMDNGPILRKEVREREKKQTKIE